MMELRTGSLLEKSFAEPLVLKVVGLGPGGACDTIRSLNPCRQLVVPFSAVSLWSLPLWSKDYLGAVQTSD